MIMCSVCKKRVAVVFVTKMENGAKTSKGLCIKCAKDAGLPVNNMMDGMMEKFGISPEQLDSMEDEVNGLLANGELGLPSDIDDQEDGGAPAVDLPNLFREVADVLGPNATPSSSDNPMKNNAEHSGTNIPNHKNKDLSANKNAKNNRFLTTYCRNLTQMAKEGKLDNIVGRKNELARMIQILCRRQKNNPCLIGEPGVGKTAIAEALAIEIAEGHVPYKLKNKEIFLLDLTALIAGTQFRGQFESRVLGLLSEVKTAGNIILVIDEVHNIVGTGDSEGSVNAANMLKPALSRGEVQIIGATTLNEYRKYIEKDTALERRFQPILVAEPSVEESIDMLKGIKHYYEGFHHIIVPDEILEKTVILSERYITDRYLPDKAIDLLDEAASKVSLESSSLNESLEIKDKLLELKSKREKLENIVPKEDGEAQTVFEEITKIKSDEMRLADNLSHLENESPKVVLKIDDIAKVVEIWTGIPASSISENEFSMLDHLDERLKQHIIGQDEAVSAVTRAIKRNRAGISYKRKPVSFIFAGPTGVGKTELVKTLANDLFHSPETLIRLDMSEFMEKHSVSRIIGAPPGYVGYDEAGQLTEKIRRRPYSIVLFDEIEKAHPDVLNILLQILDDGQVTDAHGKKVNFENTVIVMTTNAGSDSSSAMVGFSSNGKETSLIQTEKALSSFLRPEFMNRVDEIITFRSLDRSDFVQIASIMLKDLSKALMEHDLHLLYSDEVTQWVAESAYSQKYGARNMRRFIQKNIEDPIASHIIADYSRSYSQIGLSMKDNCLDVRCL